MKKFVPVEVRLESAIKLFRHHQMRCKEVWDIYSEIEHAYYMFEYHHDMMLSMKSIIIILLDK